MTFAQADVISRRSDVEQPNPEGDQDGRQHHRDTHKQSHPEHQSRVTAGAEGRLGQRGHGIVRNANDDVDVIIVIKVQTEVTEKAIFARGFRVCDVVKCPRQSPVENDLVIRLTAGRTVRPLLGQSDVIDSLLRHRVFQCGERRKRLVASGRFQNLDSFDLIVPVAFVSVMASVVRVEVSFVENHFSCDVSSTFGSGTATRGFNGGVLKEIESTGV